MQFVQIADDESFSMPGSEGTGKYKPVIKTNLAQIGVREFRPNWYRIRVEPTSAESAAKLAQCLDRTCWKQPGDQGEPRFSIVVEGLQACNEILRLAMTAVSDGVHWVRVYPGMPTPVVKLVPAPPASTEPTGNTSKAQPDITSGAYLTNPFPGVWELQNFGELLDKSLDRSMRKLTLSLARSIGVKGVNSRWGLAALQAGVSKKQAEMVLEARQRQLPGCNLAAVWPVETLCRKLKAASSK